MSGQWERTGAQFEATPWTILHALHGDEAARTRSLEELSRRYWPAVYGFLRRGGMAREEAGETTQGFFVDVVLSRALFDQADPASGRLRSLMLTALRRYVIDRHRRAASRKDRSGLPPGMLDEAERVLADNTAGSPDAAFDRAWAAGVMKEALRRTAEHFDRTGKSEHWRLFEARVVRPAARGASPRELSQVFEEHGFRSAADAAAAVQTVKRRVHSLLHEVVCETVAQADDVEDETRALRAALAIG